MTRKLSAEIKIALFDQLDKIAAIAEVSEKEDDPDKHFTYLHEIQDRLDTFAENFFIQLFEAFDLNIDYISEETMSDVENYFSEYNGEVPSNVLEIFKELFEVVEDMDDDVYFDSPQADQTIDYAYFTFLPKLFVTLKKDESILQKKVSNYGAVKIRMESTLVKIGAIKQQLALP